MHLARGPAVFSQAELALAPAALPFFRRGRAAKLSAVVRCGTIACSNVAGRARKIRVSRKGSGLGQTPSGCTMQAACGVGFLEGGDGVAGNMVRFSSIFLDFQLRFWKLGRMVGYSNFSV